MRKLIRYLSENNDWVFLLMTLIALPFVWLADESFKSLPLTYRILAVILIFGIMIALTFYVRSQRLFKSDFSFEQSIYKQLESVRQSLAEPKQDQLAGIVEQKKDKYLNLSNISFHFADKEKIVSYYNDYFKEPTVEQVVSELVGEVNSEIKGKIPQVIESKVGGKDISKWISTIKLPDISTAEMFRRWQRETIKNNQVALGLELVDIDLSDLDSFDKLVSQLKSKFEMQIDVSQIELHRALLKRKAAENTIIRLENATGMVLIEGKFRITDFSVEYYKCIYNHPVNEYVAEEDKDVSVTIVLKKDMLEPSIAGNYTQAIGKSIPLTLYGKVFFTVDRKSNVWELQISPLAVY